MSGSFWDDGTLFDLDSFNSFGTLDRSDSLSVTDVVFVSGSFTRYGTLLYFDSFMLRGAFFFCDSLPMPGTLEDDGSLHFDGAVLDSWFISLSWHSTKP